jgi:hypothetical protein
LSPSAHPSTLADRSLVDVELVGVKEDGMSAMRCPSIRSHRSQPLADSGFSRQVVLAVLLASLLAPNLAATARADDVSDGRRILGTTLGSLDGALLARAVTMREERTPVLAMLYAAAVGGGAVIGYASADSDNALRTMGIVMIPLVILNVALPRANISAAPAQPMPWWGDALLGCTPIRGGADGWRVSPVQIRF